ncbi:MAG: hypothetical protein GX567_19030 [Clostridia bacterium]|nr:hypothetical protein [Clostridia bacterium]
MKNLTCKNCGGMMTLDASAVVATCHYCGSSYVLNHEDTDYYMDFYNQMCDFLSGDEDERNRKLKSDRLWENAAEQSFQSIDGNNIEIKYMYRYAEKEADVYIARRNIVYHFREPGVSKLEQYRKVVSFIDYPSADTRQLSNFFPKVNGGFELTDGTYILVVKKEDDEYPLRLFGKLPGRHVAWIISRMENLCCVLEYNSLVHPQINPDTLFINPYAHTASLYGNWWNAGKNHSYMTNGSTLLTMKQNLQGLRNSAAYLLGCDMPSKVKETSDIPKALADFISGEPADNAYDDFAYWDKMLIQAYGKRKFVKMGTDDEQIYTQKE